MRPFDPNSFEDSLLCGQILLAGSRSVSLARLYERVKDLSQFSEYLGATSSVEQDLNKIKQDTAAVQVQVECEIARARLAKISESDMYLSYSWADLLWSTRQRLSISEPDALIRRLEGQLSATHASIIDFVTRSPPLSAKRAAMYKIPKHSADQDASLLLKAMSGHFEKGSLYARTPAEQNILDRAAVQYCAAVGCPAVILSLPAMLLTKRLSFLPRFCLAGAVGLSTATAATRTSPATRAVVTACEDICSLRSPLGEACKLAAESMAGVK